MSDPAGKTDQTCSERRIHAISKSQKKIKKIIMSRRPSSPHGEAHKNIFSIVGLRDVVVKWK